MFYHHKFELPRILLSSTCDSRSSFASKLLRRYTLRSGPNTNIIVAFISKPIAMAGSRILYSPSVATIQETTQTGMPKAKIPRIHRTSLWFLIDLHDRIPRMTLRLMMTIIYTRDRTRPSS